jgi:hypothetical protein
VTQARAVLATLVLVLPACSSDAEPDDGPGAASSGSGTSSAGTNMGGTSSAGTNSTPGGAGNSVGGSDGGSGDSSGAPAQLRGPCKDGTRLGGFGATLEDDYTTISGKVMSKFVRSTILTKVQSDDACTLIKAENPYCAGGCASGEMCSSDATCVASAISQSVGDVAIAGFARAVSMKPVVPGNNYFVSGDVEFPHPGFEAGAPAELSAQGGDLPAFSLHGTGVARLQLAGDDWQLERGKPLAVTWDEGAVGDARVRVTLRVDQHGNSPVTMTCLTEDDGELEIAAKLVDALLDAGVSGFPTGNVYRETLDSVELDAGCIEFSVGAHEQRTLKVAGYVPCMKQADCPDGTTCNLTLERCE